jgi:hypothetical protein
MSDFPPPGPPPVPPPPPPAPGGPPAPGWWQASDGNWYPPDQQPGYAMPPGYGGQPGYGYGYGYGMPASKPTNGLAIASLVCGCAQFIAWIVTGIPAIILGHIALAQIKRTGQEGRGMAIAGLVLGYLGLVAFIAFIILVIAVTDDTTTFESDF